MNSNITIEYNSKNYKRFKFMHINKTGGYSFYNWCIKNLNICFEGQDGAGGHCIITDFEDDVLYFTIVRNPYDRIASHFYQWLKQGSFGYNHPDPNSRCLRVSDPDDLVQYLMKGKAPRDGLIDGGFTDFGLPPRITFEKHNELLEAKHSYKEFKYFIPCSEWIIKPNKFVIFKTEQLSQAESWFLSKGLASIGNTEPLSDYRYPKTQTECKGSYKHLYSDPSIEFIQEHYHDDFVNFGYDK